MKVEVELDDLETLIFATAIIKNFESLLSARKQDPFVRPHLDYTIAHNNLTATMTSAKRADAGTLVPWNEELSDKEFLFLYKKFIDCPVFEIDGEYRQKHEEIDSLAAKGCIRMGQLVAGAVWAGEDRPDIKPVAGFAIMRTQRGTNKVEKILEQKRNGKS